MPVPVLAPLLGSLVASSLPAIGQGITTALGGAAASGAGRLIASAAPSAIGAGIGTLAAGGDTSEAIANAAMFGAGGTAINRGTADGGNGNGVMNALQSANAALAQPAPAPMAQQGIMRGQPVGAAPAAMTALPQQGVSPAVMAMQPQMPAPMMAAMPAQMPQQGIMATPQMQQLPMMADGGYVEGPGTGRSDSIPARIFQDGVPVQEARLSDGEFVMTERAVRGAGGGDRAKGAAKMYRMMKEFERGGRV